MHTFRVWAPAASSVEVALDGDRLFAMARESAAPGSGGGWWAVQVTEAGPGTDYRFSVDGGEPRPDPRSSWQPGGVDGPSRVVDHSAFPWTDGGWRGIHLPSAVVYEGHVGTFSEEGTFAGMTQHLDHLVDLGVDALELMPVAEFSGDRGWGYDGVDLFAPHHAYGGPDGLKALIDACHSRGLAVIIDVVYNHLGPAGNYLGRYGPYFTDRYATPWGQAVNLDGPGSDEVRAFLVDNALSWLSDYHADGLRLDAVHAIVDTSALHFLEELAGRVEELSALLGRSVFVVAESDLNDPRLVRSREAGGYGLDAQWSDDFHHALFAVMTGERSGYYGDFGRLSDVGRALRGAYVYDGRWSAFRGRHHGRPVGGLPGTRFVGYLEDHDQVGNRALGERTASLLGEDRVAVGLGLVLLSPFVPMLFQGEEWGAATPFLYFTDHRDPALGQAVSDGRRREFQAFGWEPDAIPDPQALSSFLASKLDWSEPRRPAGARLLSWTRSLIALRRAWPELADGRLDRVEVSLDEEAGWLTMRRGRIVVAANLGGAPVSVEVGAGPAPAGVGSGSPGGRGGPPDGGGSAGPVPGSAGRLLARSRPGASLEGPSLLLPPDSLAVVCLPGPAGPAW
ncbi:MAG: malto-oligosyltrehalose trehalohydrolase [Acidimicrobiales bacterium]